MFCDLQKEHMRQLKLDMGSCSIDKGGVTTKNKKKGFVANCLLKVTCSSEAGANVTELKVSFVIINRTCLKMFFHETGFY